MTDAPFFPDPTTPPTAGTARRSVTRDDCVALDIADPLAALRQQFRIPPGLIYLDGNSLGAMPAAAPAAVARAVEKEWGEGLIRSWNDAGWIDLPREVGDAIAPLIGAEPGQVVAADSTSVNLFKVLTAAASLAAPQPGDGGGAPPTVRRVILSERSNFPTDLYIAEAICARHGLVLELAELDAIAARLAGERRDEIAVLMLTQVNYRTGRMADMAHFTGLAHAAGALTVWDLAHSAGAVPVNLLGAQADFAIGCGYKYLNGGPGAPAFVWVHPRHVDRFRQPLSGWMGHATPFTFDTGYAPADGIARYLCGTPSILGLRALAAGVATVRAADAYGGLQALRAKSLALGDLFIGLVQQRLPDAALTLATPTDHAQRGSQVSLACPAGMDGHAVMGALIARGVIGDFRAGRGGVTHADDADDLLRFGFTPLYTRFTDVWDAVQALHTVITQAEWRQPRFQNKGKVT